MQYLSMLQSRQSLLETDILVSNLKKRRALSSTSVWLNKIRNIVFLIFLIRIKPYNTSKIRIIQTRIIRSSTIVDRRDRLVLRFAAMFVFAHVYSIPLSMRPRLSRPARYVRPDYTRGCTCTHRPPYLPIHGVTVERRERTSWRGKRGN